MDSVDFWDIVKKIEACFAQYQPDIVYTPHFNDLNVDHRICHLAVLTAARPLPGLLCDKFFIMKCPQPQTGFFLAPPEWNLFLIALRILNPLWIEK